MLFYSSAPAQHERLAARIEEKAQTATEQKGSAQITGRCLIQTLSQTLYI